MRPLVQVGGTSFVLYDHNGAISGLGMDECSKTGEGNEAQCASG